MTDSQQDQTAGGAAKGQGPEVRREIIDGIGWVVFDRPDAANAARPSMMEQVCAAIDAHVADPAVKAVVIRGEGRHFLGGGDLDWLADVVAGRATGAADNIYRWFQGAARRLYDCPKPTLAAISGAAFTVGAELALACDVRLVDRSAYFDESWLALGLIAPLGGARWLSQIIGVGQAKEMLLECRRVRAEEAVAIGLASEMLDNAADLHARAQERAAAMAARPPAAFARMKALIHAGLDTDQQAAWQAGIKAQGELLESADFRTAIRHRRPNA